MKKYQNIEFKLEKYIATVWLNRPDKHNALNTEMIDEIIEVFLKIDSISEARVAVLRGKGKSFCAGADLNYMKDIAKFGFEENYQDSLNLAKAFKTIYNCKKPTIAVVHGASIGGANGLLAACDFVYCNHETKFAFSEVKLGIAPATISPYVIKRIGEYGARNLMLTGKRFLGQDAERYRLVNKSTDAEELESYVNRTVKQLMSSGPEAMASCKELIANISNTYDFEDSLEYTAKLIAELRASKEGQEGMASFLNKRKPNWVNE